MQFFRKLKNFFKNCWYWKEFLWHDRDWDYYFLFWMVELKLRKMKPVLLDDPYTSVGRKKTVEKTITRAINYLSWYNNVGHIQDPELHRMGDEAKHFSVKKLNKSYSTLVMSDEYRARLRSWDKLSEETKQRCLERAFKAIVKSHGYWWT